MDVLNSLRKRTNEVFEIFTKVELIDQDYFPTPRPDLYLRRHDFSRRPSELLLFMVNDVLRFVFVKKFKSWLSHYEDEGWDGDYPTILLVCITASIARRVGEYLLELGLDDELHILLTTKEAVLGGKSKIWIDYQIKESLLNLT